MSLQKIEKLQPFKRFCMTIGELPASYMASMTYLELLMWLCKYISEQVIPTINNNAKAVEELMKGDGGTCICEKNNTLVAIPLEEALSTKRDQVSDKMRVFKELW